jgi:hypothetical protein
MVGIFSSFPTVEEGRQKGPKEMQESPWGLHMGTLWKLPFMTCSRRLGVGQSGLIGTGYNIMIEK